MKFTTALSFAPVLAGYTVAESAVLEPRGHIASNPDDSSQSVLGRIPTAYESAVLGRRILALTPLGTLSTIFPDSSSDGHFTADERRPAGLGGVPVGMMDYVADCEGEGNPTILAINIATTFKNVRAGSNISLAQAWTPRYAPDKRIKSSGACGFWGWLSGVFGSSSAQDDAGARSGGADSVPYSAANLPRYSLLGYLEKIEASKSGSISSCFVKQHPDAKYWLPGNSIHEAEFVRLVVTQVYWVGGFGDRAYIGWIDPADWKNVTRKEWEDVRLPGEKKGWDEWRVEI